MQTNQAVKEAVQKEMELGKFVLHRYSTKLSRFEKKYNMATEKFIKKFEEGKLGDEQDYFEWFALFKTKKHWEDKLKQLTA
ncbi:MAG: hypothetical protein AABW61_00675 [Candidatus Aenigmatarchaeota archaeon]